VERLFVGPARLCSILVVLCSLMHLAMVFDGHHPLWFRALLVGVTVWCLRCAGHVWNGARIETLKSLMASSVLVAVMHWLMLVASRPGGSHLHGGTAGVPSTGMDWTMLVAIAFELLVGLCAALLLNRLRIAREKRWSERPTTPCVLPAEQAPDSIHIQRNYV
jgi:hypothetical protein